MITANCFNLCIPEDLYQYFFGHHGKAEITGRLNQGKRDYLMKQNQDTQQPSSLAEDHREVRYGELCDILLERGYYPSIRPIRWGEETKWESGWYNLENMSGFSGNLHDTPKEALYDSILEIIKTLEEDERS
jgi:hypothetical protein